MSGGWLLFRGKNNHKPQRQSLAQIGPSQHTNYTAGGEEEVGESRVVSFCPSRINDRKFNILSPRRRRWEKSNKTDDLVCSLYAINDNRQSGGRTVEDCGLLRAFTGGRGLGTEHPNRTIRVRRVGEVKACCG